MNKYIKCDEEFIDEAMRVCSPSTIAAINIKHFLESYPEAENVIEIERGEDGNGQA